MWILILWNCFILYFRHKNITVIKITSFVKSYSFSLDYGHLYNMDNIHVWNAVLIDNTYHHVDCSWGALPINGKRISNGDIEDVEHFFFTSPEIIGEMCWKPDLSNFCGKSYIQNSYQRQTQWIIKYFAKTNWTWVNICVQCPWGKMCTRIFRQSVPVRYCTRNTWCSVIVSSVT